MIHTFSLSNFKAFGHEQHVPLRPITLIFGANSSGKSSLLHALLLARHALVKSSWDVNHVELAGDSVELGGFANYLHKKDQNIGKALAFSFDHHLNSDIALQGTLLAHASDVHITLTVSLGDGDVASLKSCQVDIDGARLFLLAPKNDDQMGIILWETDHPLSQRIVDWACQRASIGSSKPDYEARVKEEMVAIHSLAALGEFTFLPAEVIFPSGLTPTEAELNSLLLTEKVAPDKRISVAVRSLYPQILRDLFSDLYRLFSSDLRALEYLGPLRSYPSRTLSDDEATDPNWRAGGGFAWKAVLKDDSLRQKVNVWLEQNPKSKYQLQVRKLVEEDSVRRVLERSLANHDIELIQKVAAREESGDSIAAEINLMDFNCEEYLKSNPDFHEYLVDFSTDYFCDTFKDLESEERDEAMKSAARDYVASEVRNNGGDLWEQIRMHYLENNSEISTIAASLSDPSRSAHWVLQDIMNNSKRNRTELVLFDLRSKTAVTHRDVGIGISQVLPILVHAYASKNKLIAIEQPEIHLHPALQAELGDLFIESALGENRNHFILETHSEHLILRLLRRIRETKRNKLPEGKRPLRAEDVSILYVAPEEQGSRVLVMNVNEHGKLTNNWPEGFFEERLAELF
jgi:predicted ATPase